MILSLATIIGAYTIMRMLELLSRDKKVTVRIFNLVTTPDTIISRVDSPNAGSHGVGLNGLEG
jgi:hypothetical protein